MRHSLDLEAQVLIPYACSINFIRTLLIKHTVIRIFSFLSCNQLIRALIVSSNLILIFGLSRLMLASQELQREKATPWIMRDQRKLKYQRLLEQPATCNTHMHVHTCTRTHAHTYAHTQAHKNMYFASCMWRGWFQCVSACLAGFSWGMCPPCGCFSGAI